MRQSLEQERERLVAEVKKQTESEKQQAVDETKKKQWCANCRKEAIFYCCWNTSYCDYPCQQAHWPEHMKSCTQSGNKHAHGHGAPVCPMCRVKRGSQLWWSVWNLRWLLWCTKLLQFDKCSVSNIFRLGTWQEQAPHILLFYHHCSNLIYRPYRWWRNAFFSQTALV